MTNMIVCPVPYVILDDDHFVPLYLVAGCRVPLNMKIQMLTKFNELYHFILSYKISIHGDLTLCLCASVPRTKHDFAQQMRFYNSAAISPPDTKSIVFLFHVQTHCCSQI